MNKHDQHRIDQVKRTLTKAKEQLEIVRLYLVVADPQDPIAIDMHDTEDYIDIALEKLGAVVVTT